MHMPVWCFPCCKPLGNLLDMARDLTLPTFFMRSLHLRTVSREQRATHLSLPKIHCRFPFKRSVVARLCHCVIAHNIVMSIVLVQRHEHYFRFFLDGRKETGMLDVLFPRVWYFS
jgi:hypothetical protein